MIVSLIIVVVKLSVYVLCGGSNLVKVVMCIWLLFFSVLVVVSRKYVFIR